MITIAKLTLRARAYCVTCPPVRRFVICAPEVRVVWCACEPTPHCACAKVKIFAIHASSKLFVDNTISSVCSTSCRACQCTDKWTYVSTRAIKVNVCSAQPGTHDSSHASCGGPPGCKYHWSKQTSSKNQEPATCVLSHQQNRRGASCQQSAGARRGRRRRCFAQCNCEAIRNPSSRKMLQQLAYIHARALLHDRTSRRHRRAKAKVGTTRNMAGWEADPGRTRQLTSCRATSGSSFH